MNTIKRQLKTNASIDGGSGIAIEHNLPAGAKKTIPGIGYLEYLGTNGSPISVDPGAIIAAYRNAATVGLVQISTATIGADPAAIGAGVIAARPNDYTHIAIGTNCIIRCDANTHLYLLVDYTYAIEEK